MSVHPGQLTASVDFETMLEGATDAVVAIDHTNAVIFFNKAAETMWKMPRDKVLGQNVKMLVDPGVRDEHDSLLARHRQTQEHRIVGKTRDLILTASDGSTMAVNLGLSQWHDPEGRIGYLATIKDISEKAAAMEEAKSVLTGLSKTFEEVRRNGQVVSTLANRTNMLSLNAAIEASRAGEFGKSFSVVAGEVKQLAQNTSETATRIEQSILQIEETIELTIKQFEALTGSDGS